MTEANKQLNIREEIARRGESFEAAQALIDAHLLNDAVSRLYYALFHSAKALLLSLGLEPRTHEGVAALFSLHFVKKGVFKHQDLLLLSRMLKYREEADYSASYTFTARDCNELMREVVTLWKRIRVYLSGKRYL